MMTTLMVGCMGRDVSTKKQRVGSTMVKNDVVGGLCG